ncbi:MAG: ATP-dependent helicase, partial [Sphaerochaetaceae bacterium]
GIDIFCKKLAYFEQKNPGHPVSQFINRISLDSKDEDEEAMGTVKLMTMHAAKGLEFHTVFLAAVEEPYIPSGKALEENSENIEEERRLFYVAITRAKVDLVISTCINRERNGKEMVCVPSRFLSEIPKSLFDEDDPNRKVGKNEAIDRLAAFREKLARMSEQKK